MFCCIGGKFKAQKNRPYRAAFVGSSGFIGWLCDEN
jgi:hypothetical protein